MFGQVRNSSIEDIFNFQREFGSLSINSVTPRPVQTTPTYPFHVHTAEDSWRVEIPMPGVDPTHVTLEVAGNTIVCPRRTGRRPPRRCHAMGADDDGAADA